MEGSRKRTSPREHSAFVGLTEVNNEIRLTASNTPDRFWYFNNGITLVADEAVKAPGRAASRSAGAFQFRGASIVNGAQTVNSLGKVESDTSLGLVLVPIRVILLKTAPTGFGKDVTRTICRIALSLAISLPKIRISGGYARKCQSRVSIINLCVARTRVRGLRHVS